jgi:hypothetical protein
MSSWPDPTGELWSRRDPRADAIAHAAALLGSDTARVADAACVSLAASPAATTLLEQMPTRIATLSSVLVTTPQRCSGSVRGPILWSATMSARSSAAGSHEVVVCATTRRSFDTAENRLLVAVLESLASARTVIDAAPEARPIEAAEGDDRARIVEVARQARAWRRHPRLAGLRGEDPTARELTKLRGRRRAGIDALLAMRRLATCPVPGSDPLGLVDPWTAGYHGFVLHVLDVLAPTVALPEAFSAHDGELRCGPVTWRHPRSRGAAPTGVSYRGVPLLPPPRVYAAAPWAPLVPSDGVRIAWGRWPEQPAPAAPAATRRAQYSSSSSSSRSSR